MTQPAGLWNTVDVILFWVFVCEWGERGVGGQLFQGDSQFFGISVGMHVCECFPLVLPTESCLKKKTNTAPAGCH